jgi:hydrogenase maturation protease
VVTGGPLEDRITFSLRPTGGGGRRASAMMNRETVSADGPGRTTVQHTIDLRDPSPWWPRDLGDQHRYTLRAKLGDSERSVTTGLCSVTREGGRLRINGQPMPVRGVNLLTDDPADVERAADLHANLVRAPAHVLSPAVYEACDEAGLVVWQGLPLTGPGAFDVDRGHDLATRLVDTYGRHPSLGPIGVHDEPTDTFADGLGDGFLDRLRLRWRAWRVAYDGSPAERVAEALGERDLPPGVTVTEVGISGVSMAQDLMDGYDAMVLVDAMERGADPGTVHVERAEVPDLDDYSRREIGSFAADMHQTDPSKVLVLGEALSVLPEPTVLVGCEPRDTDDLADSLSEPVRAAVPRAVDHVETVLAEVRSVADA